MTSRFFPLLLSLSILIPSHIAASLFCLPRCESEWILASASILAVAGGAVAGYSSGGKEKMERCTKVVEQFAFATSNEVRTLEWLPPPSNPAAPLSIVEIFRPDQTLYFSEQIGQETMPLNPPPIGAEGPAQVGQYRVVFTVVVPGGGPASLGGISMNGEPFHTPIINLNPIPNGHQQTIILDYPSGLALGKGAAK